MLEFLKDSSIIFIRIVTILPLVLFVTIFMGKRTVGEVRVFDFLVIIILGSVVGADIAEPNIEHIPTAVAIVGIGVLQKVVSTIMITNRKIGHLITFEPTIVIQSGKLLNENLKKIHYTIDNILQLLREKDIFDISEVETAVIEGSGNISVLKKNSKNTVTLGDMGIDKKTSGITLPLIMEGKVYSDVLRYFNLDIEWLEQQLKEKGIYDFSTVFFASINPNHELQVSLKNERGIFIPIMKH